MKDKPYESKWERRGAKLGAVLLALLTVSVGAVGYPTFVGAAFTYWATFWAEAGAISLIGYSVVAIVFFAVAVARLHSDLGEIGLRETLGDD